MQILVTGAAGFIGSHLVERLLEGGAAVLGLDCFDNFYDPTVKRANLSHAMEHPRFRLIEGDIRDGEMLRESVGEPLDCIVHLAARPGVASWLCASSRCTARGSGRPRHSSLHAAPERGQVHPAVRSGHYEPGLHIRG